MKSGMRKLQFLLVVALLSISSCFAQKVNVGFDKTVNFSKYKSYTLREPAVPPTRPILYASIMGSIQNDLHAKGFDNVKKDGDLTLIATGGFDYGLKSDPDLLSDSCQNCQAPLVDPLDWKGQITATGSVGKSLPKGTLKLTFVDRATNKVVWVGTVSQKLDPAKQDQAMQRVNTAIDKLMAEFPSKK